MDEPGGKWHEATRTSKGPSRVMPVPGPILLASVLALAAACGSAAVQAPTPLPTLLGATPVPTIPGVIGECEIGSGAECPGADFSDMDLSAGVVGWHQEETVGREGADFTDANLKGAKFIGTNLEGTDLSRADLREANFQLSNLTEAVLLEADASGADFSLATLESAEFEGANLSEADFSSAVMKGGDFTGADFTRAVLRDASLVGAFLSDADFTGADLTRANLTFAEVDGAILEGAIFCDTKMADRTVNNEGCK